MYVRQRDDENIRLILERQKDYIHKLDIFFHPSFWMKTNINEWSHIKTEDNPAYFISRGCEAIRLKSIYLWWIGPGGYVKTARNGQW